MAAPLESGGKDLTRLRSQVIVPEKCLLVKGNCEIIHVLAAPTGTLRSEKIWHLFCIGHYCKEVAMLAQIFFYFLLIGELAVLGLLIVGIITKVKRILQTYYFQGDV